MSRLAKKSITLPQGVTFEEKDGEFVFKGPKGEVHVMIPKMADVNVTGDVIKVTPRGNSGQAKADAGTSWSLIKNAISGVTLGFSKTLEIEGVGYRATMDGDTLVLSLGFVNPVRVKVPVGITIVVEKNSMKISGINKELVGSIASQIRGLKKPEPYKGKGIRYQGEVIKRKVGKKAATTTGT